MSKLLSNKCKFINISKDRKKKYKQQYLKKNPGYSFADFVHIQTAKENGLKMVSFDRHLQDARSKHWNYKIDGQKVKRLYLDASAFIPLVKWEGNRSTKMQDLLLRDNTKLYISNFTISEVYNVLHR